METSASTEPTLPSIAVLTCDRPNGFYVIETLRQIDKEGGAGLDRRLYVDGSVEFLERLEHRLRDGGTKGWSIVHLGENLGSTEAMRRLVVASAALGGDLLFFEDDLLLCRNAVKRMIAQRVPDDVGIVTFFDMKEVAPGAAPGLYRRPADGHHGSGFWGAQCLKFCPDTLNHLEQSKWNNEGRDGSRMASDLLIGRIMSKHPRRMHLAVHIPNLVEHVGHASACFPGLALSSRWRRASNFAGQGFDALTLKPMT
ncbi:MAG: hypothetical protein RL173_413 [Fibrobacterota bacterium]